MQDSKVYKQRWALIDSDAQYNCKRKIYKTSAHHKLKVEHQG